MTVGLFALLVAIFLILYGIQGLGVPLGVVLPIFALVAGILGLVLRFRGGGL